MAFHSVKPVVGKTVFAQEIVLCRSFKKNPFCIAEYVPAYCIPVMYKENFTAQLSNDSSKHFIM
jgi:hypothetical protein